MAQHIQYIEVYIWWKIWSSNLDRNKRSISSATHPDRSSTNPASNSSFFSGSKLANADSLTTHIHIEPSLKISGAIPPLNLSATMTHIGTTKFYLIFLPMYIFLNRSHCFWSYKGTLSIHYLPVPSTLRDPFISSPLIHLH
jgi:hypothetical protein